MDEPLTLQQLNHGRGYLMLTRDEPAMIAAALRPGGLADRLVEQGKRLSDRLPAPEPEETPVSLDQT